MSLPVTFHRAASADFIEASVWYETKRIGLALEFIAEIDSCVSQASEHPLQFANFSIFSRGNDISFRSTLIAYRRAS
jgi:hypothetical protein